MAVIKGTSSSDTLSGTGEDDEIYGYGGYDVLAGASQFDRAILAGQDRIYGGDYEDSIRDTWGLDDARPDLLSGGAGNDSILSMYGPDRLYGGAGDDRYNILDNAAAIIKDASGHDSVHVRGMENYVLPENIEDLTGVILRSATGNELSNDIDLFSEGDVDVRGGAGNDRITINASESAAVPLKYFGGTVYGDEGDDILISADGWRGVHFGFHALVGGEGNDELYGNKGNDRLKGGDGDDIVNAGHGTDRLNGGDGADRLNGDIGRDELTGGAGDDVLSGGTQIDTFVFRGNFGRDRVIDFSVAEGDVAFFASDWFADFDDLMEHADQVGDDVRITIDSTHAVTLEGVVKTNLTESSFILA